MGSIAMRSGGGLSAEDKKTVEQWMVKGHSIQNGRIEGTIPVIPKNEQDYITAASSNASKAGNLDITLPSIGYTDTKKIYVNAQNNLKQENIKNGVNIFGVKGEAKTPWFKEVQISYSGNYTVDCTSCPNYENLTAQDFGVGIESIGWAMQDTSLTTYCNISVKNYSKGSMTVSLTMKKPDGQYSGWFVVFLK